LFVTLGPLNIIVPFAAMTKGRTSASKRRLAFKAILLATIVSGGALLLAAGAILFLVALAAADRTPSESELAFSPLAFPTIVTPYGLALLILLFTLHPAGFGRLTDFAYRCVRARVGPVGNAVHRPRCEDSLHQTRAEYPGIRNWRAADCTRCSSGGGWSSFSK
jgi:small neutral amino acid transporter SnatA (MarC family)